MIRNKENDPHQSFASFQITMLHTMAKKATDDTSLKTTTASQLLSRSYTLLISAGKLNCNICAEALLGQDIYTFCFESCYKLECRNLITVLPQVFYERIS